MLEALQATDTSGLSAIADLLHDEWFDFDALDFDAGSGVVVIPVRRQLHDGPERLIDDGPLAKTYEKDWFVGRLTIRGVRSWEAVADQGIGVYSLCSAKYVNGLIELRACEALVLKFQVSGIDIAYEDDGTSGKARLKRGPFGILSLSGKVYE